MTPNERGRRTVTGLYKAFANAPMAIFEVDAEDRLISWNAAAERLYGWSADDVIGGPASRVLVSANETVTRPRRVLSPKRVRVRTPGGRAVDTAMTVIDRADGEGGSAYFQADPSQDGEEHRQRILALRDPLTGLPDRTLFMDRLGHALTLVERRGGFLAVLYVDLDEFKHLNDQYGHTTGDAVLAAVAERLRTRLRTTDTASRLGGDEFAVLLEDLGMAGHDKTTAAAAALQVADKVAALIAEPIVIEGRELSVRASLGLAIGTIGTDALGLLCDADTAMYLSKREGKGTVRMFDDATRHEADLRKAMVAELRDAVAGGRIRLESERVVNLQTGALAGVLTAPVWQREDGSTPNIETVLDLAAEHGLAVPIGRQLLLRCCELASGVAEVAVGSWVMVPVHAAYLRSGTLGSDMHSSLSSHALDADRIVVGIQERAVLADLETASRTLAELRHRGVRVLLRDFGVDVAALQTLLQVPLDFVAIAPPQTFKNPLHDILPTLVTRLAAHCDFEAIAQGITTSAAAGALADAGCRYGTGPQLEPSAGQR